MVFFLFKFVYSTSKRIKDKTIISLGITFLNIMNILIIAFKIKYWKSSIVSKYNKHVKYCC